MSISDSDDYKIVLGPFPELGYGEHYPENWSIGEHAHTQDQLLHPGSGMLTVHTEQGGWLVPPERAVWIPAGTVHSVTAILPVDNRSLFLNTSTPARPGRRCEVVGVSLLLRALLAEAYDTRESGSPRRRKLLMSLLFSEIETAPSLPLSLPQPRNPMLAKLCQEYIANPAPHASIDSWSARLNMSRRTFTRMFRGEVGMSFTAWRQQASSFAALPRLAAGESVTAVAFDLGYSSTAAFSTMFKRVHGHPPSHYLH